MLNNILFCELRIRRIKYSAFPIKVCLMHYFYSPKIIFDPNLKTLNTYRLASPEGVLNFGLGRYMLGRPEGRKWGLVERISAIFDKLLLSEVIFGPNWGFLNLIHRFLGLGTENLPKLSILNGKFGNVWFWLIVGSCGAEKCWKVPYFLERPRECEKRVFTAGHLLNIFKGSPEDWVRCGIVHFFSSSGYLRYFVCCRIGGDICYFRYIQCELDIYDTYVANV